MIPVINPIKTGEIIRRLMKDNDMSVRYLQTIFDFKTPQAIYKWQRGASIPSIDNLVILADIFYVNIEDILAIEKNY